LKAVNNYRLYDGATALEEFERIADLDKVLLNNDILRHNMVVFTNGQRALQVLPALMDSIPESRLNLAIKYLHQKEYDKANELLENVEPSTPQEYILKGVVNTEIGQNEGSRAALDSAKTYFQVVGTSPNETDTIPGRQAMASCLFLLKQFEDVKVYLSSIRSYMGKSSKLLYLMSKLRCALTLSFIVADV